ncbi:hypothetical protein RJ640_010526, partial [Escallonia rubra]
VNQLVDVPPMPGDVVVNIGRTFSSGKSNVHLCSIVLLLISIFGAEEGLISSDKFIRRSTEYSQTVQVQEYQLHASLARGFFRYQSHRHTLRSCYPKRICPSIGQQR